LENKLVELLKKLSLFRDQIYHAFGYRSDTNMNTLDALSTYGHRCKSVVELSEAPCFERQYTSLTDGIADGLVPSTFTLSKMTKVIYDLEKTTVNDVPNTSKNRVLLVVDCTPNPRPTARKLKDRHITHAPNPAPGNKPICVGHEYSTLAMVPQDKPSREKHWLIPLSTERVPSDKKGHEIGMDQVKACIEALDLQEELVVSIADSKYGTESCRKKVIGTPNWVQLFRLNSTRNVYSLAQQPSSKDGSTKKHSKRYGKKMTLNKVSTHTTPHDELTTRITSARGRSYSVMIKVWYNQCVRGSRQFKGDEHPMTICQIVMTDEAGKTLHKKPMWLAASGQRRRELSVLDIFEYYRYRYDIEHFFRFGKDKLLIDAYQTPDTRHEEAWWNLASASYAQLYFARDSVPLLPKKWERYLPCYQSCENQEASIVTPSQTQRGFSTVLETMGTPAKPCIPRGIPKGRSAGDKPAKRPTHSIVFKANATKKTNKTNTNSKTEKPAQNSEQQNIEKLAKSVKTQLKNMGCEIEAFHQLLAKMT
jgi:hypothetical protein